MQDYNLVWGLPICTRFDDLDPSRSQVSEAYVVFLDSGLCNLIVVWLLQALKTSCRITIKGDNQHFMLLLFECAGASKTFFFFLKDSCTV